MADIIQKATEWDKQAAVFKKTRPLDTLHQTHLMQPKYDGCHLIINTTDKRAFSRTNETVRSCAHLVDQAVRAFGQGWVVQGEAWMQDTAFPFISGKYRQHDPWPDMLLMAYDCLPTASFAAGFEQAGYNERRAWLEEAIQHPGCPELIPSESKYALGYDVQARANELVASGGYDGLILRSPTAPWRAGPSRMGELVKVKPTTSLDLRVVAVHRERGDKTGRDVWSVTVEYRGVETRVGSGMPHNEAAVPGPGQIIEVECMAVNPNNTLREPRFKGIRYDKTEPDE